MPILVFSTFSTAQWDAAFFFICEVYWKFTIHIYIVQKIHFLPHHLFAQFHLEADSSNPMLDFAAKEKQQQQQEKNVQNQTSKKERKNWWNVIKFIFKWISSQQSAAFTQSKNKRRWRRKCICDSINLTCECGKLTRRSCAGISFTCCNVKFVITDCWDGCCCGCDCVCCCCWVCCCDCCYVFFLYSKRIEFSVISQKLNQLERDIIKLREIYFSRKI